MTIFTTKSKRSWNLTYILILISIIIYCNPKDVNIILNEFKANFSDFTIFYWFSWSQCLIGTIKFFNFTWLWNSVSFNNICIQLQRISKIKLKITIHHRLDSCLWWLKFQHQTNWMLNKYCFFLLLLGC